MNKKPREQTNIRRGLRAILRHAVSFRPLLTWLVLLGFVSAVANGVVPYATGRFFDALIDVSHHAQTAMRAGLPAWGLFLLVWVIVQLVANNIDWLKDRMKRRAGTGIWFNIQAEGFIQMFKLPLSYHKNVHTNGEIQKINMASWQISTVVEQLADTGPQLLSVAIGLGLAASISLPLASIMLVGVALYVIALVWILKPIALIDEERHRIWNQGWNDAAASVQQIESVKQSAAEEHEIRKVRDSLVGRAAGLSLKIENSWNNIEFAQRSVVFLTQLAIFMLSVRFVMAGEITVGQLVALNGYSLMFFGPFAQLGNNWKNIQNGITSAAQLEDIFDEKTEAYQPAGAVRLDKVRGRIALRGVHFRYSPHQPEILTGIDLDIAPGQVVALVGESGVGKSTSIQLISGYYFPTSGSVEIDGTDTRRLDLTALRRQIGVVPQEVALFNDSILMNIKYGTFGASDSDVKRVAKEAHLEEFIAGLPEGYETLVGERGVKLSVGQKQRVAIARAMLRDPAILILDEPTSALDAETERIITGSLEKLMKGRTTFIIAHRLSTVRKADTILVFQKGQIVEKGTHNELIAKEGGVYRKLYEYQIGLH
jgi:ATP-binding cassette subfamily B protein